MTLELWIGLVGVFLGGGAIGSAGTLLAQWLVKKVEDVPSPRQTLAAAEVDVLRSEVAEIGRHIRNLDARLDFTERLLDGALPSAPPPGRLDDDGTETA
jgi:hypothetical protein